jgi:RHS repeat-associated protein
VLDSTVGDEVVLQETTGEDTATYTYGAGLVSREAADGSIRYLLADALGSVRLETDEDGAVVKEHSYDAFGTELGTQDLSGNRFRFTGQWSDPAGLVFLRARFYDPESGCFLSVDPKPSVGSPYVYCGNCPLLRVDPSGARHFSSDRARHVNSNCPSLFSEQGALVCLMAADLFLTAVQPEIGAPIEGGLAMRLAAAGEREAVDTEAATSAAIPSRLARVVSARWAASPSLGASGASRPFVTAADDIAGIETSGGLAERLTLVDKSGKLLPGPYSVTEFDTPLQGLGSPVFRTNPGFVGKGLTAGGAREYDLPNLLIEELTNVTTRYVP